MKISYILLILALFIPVSAKTEAPPIAIVPILDAIYKLKPNLDYNLAEIIANSIEYCSLDKNIDYRLLVSIAYVESNFNPKVIRKINGRKIDYGLFQINISNIDRFNLDEKRLKDPEYNTKAACSIIEDIRTKKSNFVGYYNVGLSANKKRQRQHYLYLIAKTLSKLL